MDATVFEVESTLTTRYQTTVPAPVRRALKVGKRDKLRYTVSGDEVVLTRAPQPDAGDPVLTQFLSFLARDMKRHPERLNAISSTLRDRIHALAGDVDVDLDEPLSPDDE